MHKWKRQGDLFNEDDGPADVPDEEDLPPQFQQHNEEAVAPVDEDEEFPVQDMSDVPNEENLPPAAQDDAAPQGGMFGTVNVSLEDDVEVLEVLGDEEDFLLSGEDVKEEPCSAADQGVPASSCSRSLSLLLCGERASVTAPRLL